MKIGSGLSNITLGTSLKYEFIRESAPYMGVVWSKSLGYINDISVLDEVYVTTDIRFCF